MTPMSGVNLHHAIEMYLKGYLVRTHSEQQRRQLGHKLKRIWMETKKRANDPSLADFDRTIKTLDMVERVRYPEDLLRLGAAITVAPTSPKTPGRATGSDRGRSGCRSTRRTSTKSTVQARQRQPCRAVCAWSGEIGAQRHKRRDGLVSRQRRSRTDDCPSVSGWCPKAVRN